MEQKRNGVARNGNGNFFVYYCNALLTYVYYKYATQVGVLVVVGQQINRRAGQLYGKEIINAHIHLANYSNLISTQYSCSITP